METNGCRVHRNTQTCGCIWLIRMMRVKRVPAKSHIRTVQSEEELMIIFLSWMKSRLTRACIWARQWYFSMTKEGLGGVCSLRPAIKKFEISQTFRNLHPYVNPWNGMQKQKLKTHRNIWGFHEIFVFNWPCRIPSENVFFLLVHN